MQEKKLEMYGGLFGGLIPLIVLVGGLVWLSVAERGGTKPFWACAWIALCVGIFFAKDKEEYCKAACGHRRPHGHRHRYGVAAGRGVRQAHGRRGACAGAFVDGHDDRGAGRRLRGAGLPRRDAVRPRHGHEHRHLHCPVAGAVSGGLFPRSGPGHARVGDSVRAAFGDNLAPISDTTIVSAYTQGAEMRDVVRSRFPLAISAASISAVVFLVFGGGGEVRPLPEMQASLNPSGLFMLLALAIVVVSALKGRHIIQSLIYGNVAAAFVGMLIGTIRPADIFSVPAAKGGSTGLIQAGIDNVVGAIIFAILILAVTQILVECGIMRRILDFAQSTLVATVRQAELFIVGVTILASIPISANAPAELLVGPSIVRPLGERFGLAAARRANLMDCAVCTIFFVLPWHIAVAAWYGALYSAAETYATPPRPSARPCTIPIHGHCSLCCCSPPSPAGTESTPRMKRPPHDFGGALPRNQTERRGTASALHKGRAACQRCSPLIPT